MLAQPCLVLCEWPAREESSVEVTPSRPPSTPLKELGLTPGENTNA